MVWQQETKCNNELSMCLILLCLICIDPPCYCHNPNNKCYILPKDTHLGDDKHGLRPRHLPCSEMESKFCLPEVSMLLREKELMKIERYYFFLGGHIWWSWLCLQKSLAVVLRKSYGILGIYPRSLTSKGSALPSILSFQALKINL